MHAKEGDQLFLSLGTRSFGVREEKGEVGQEGGGGEMSSPMPGKILKVLVSVGSSVAQGDTLMVMEAMKMEHTIRACRDGVVEEIFFREGDLAKENSPLVRLKEES